MLYVQWVGKVLAAMEASENDRTRLVGIPAAALREPLGLDLSEVDAIEDALYDLQVLGMALRRPSGMFNLTALGRQAASGSIEQVCGATIRETCAALDCDERRVLRVLMELSQVEYDRFARVRYVDVEKVSDKTEITGTHEQEEWFLLPLVTSRCIDYREFKADRDVRPLLTGAVCASAALEPARPGMTSQAQTAPR